MRLIDADALINDIEELITEYEEAMRDSEEHPEKYPEDYKTRALNLIAGLIAAKVEVYCAPTIDAEPVVRCKECNSYDGEECRFHNTTVAPNDYCNYGEKADTKGESR